MSRIGVIGAGLVGKATGKGLANFGHQVVFADINEKVLQDLRESGYEAVLPENLGAAGTEVSMLSVWTPTVDSAVDLSSLESACATLSDTLRRARGYHLVVVRSTVPPGTIEDLLIPCLERSSGLTAGRDFGVTHNPEFLREASALQDYVNPWIVVFGSLDARSAEAIRAILKPISEKAGAPLIETGLRTSEMLKYASNLYNATKISFANEIWSVCRGLGIDGDEVMSIVAHSAEGNWNPHYGIRGGYPFGGSCLPQDTAAFLTFARQHGIDMRLLEAVVQVNDRIGEMQGAAPSRV